MYKESNNDQCYSLNTIEFHWDGKDGVVRNNGKYGLLLTKPSIPSVLFDTVSYVSDVVGSVGGFVLLPFPLIFTECVMKDSICSLIPLM